MNPTTKKMDLHELFLKKSFEAISSDDLKIIKGGDPTPAQIQALITNLTNNIFVFYTTGSAPVTPAYQAAFNDQVALLASTNVGYAMLTQIVAAGQQITISGHQAFGPPGSITGGAIYYESANQISIGSLDINYHAPGSWDENKLKAENFAAVAHELFHAYMDLTGRLTQTYMNSIGRELDAYLFEFMACAEVDGKNNWTYANDFMKSYTHWDSQVYTGNNIGSTPYYIEAFYDMFRFNHFNLSNYNALLNLFHNAVDVGNYSGNSNPIDQTTFDNSALKAFWNDYSHSSYFTSFLPPALFGNPFQNLPGNSGGGGSGGGGGSANPNYSFGDFMSQIYSMQNSGWIFYTGYTYTPGGGLRDPINPDVVWWNVPGQYNYTEATMGDFMSYYNVAMSFGGGSLLMNGWDGYVWRWGYY